MKTKMAKYLIVAVFALAAFAGRGQIVGESWRDHLSYNNGKALAVTESMVYCATDIGLFCYDKDDGSIRRLTTINGLSDMGVGSIAYSDANHILVIGYSNGNIDLMDDDGRVYNMSGLKDKNIVMSKNINQISFYGTRAYLSCDFGLTTIDLKRREFVDTYIMRLDAKQVKINCSAVFGEYLYAFSEDGLMRGRLDNPFLTDMKNWEYLSIDGRQLRAVSGCAFNGKLYVGESINDTISRLTAFDGHGWTMIADSIPTVRSLTSHDNRIVVCTDMGVTAYDVNLHVSKSWETTGATMGFNDGQDIWYSHKMYGLGRTNKDTYMVVLPAGPPHNRFYNVCYNAGNILVAPGGIKPPSANLYRPADIYCYDGTDWTSISKNTYTDIINCSDVVSFATCGNPDYYVAAAWRYGLLEFRNGEYNFINSVNTDSAFNDCVTSCAFDSRGNLWVASMLTQDPLAVRTVDGKWYKHHYGTNMTGQVTGKILCTRNDDLWLVQPHGSRILVWNSNGTPETGADDNYECFVPSNESGSLLNSSINDIAQDRNGAIWIASDEGVYVYDHPEYILQGKSYYGRRPQMIEEGYYQSLLITEVVTSIAIDGGNRKWFGTESGGIFVISPDGTEQYAVYNKDNSPLFSNNVLSLAIDDDRGIIYIVTDRGLQSAVISSTKPDAGMSSVYAAPNPVPADYFNDVAIRGLADETVVRITDLRGNLVHETMSNGGGALWNLCNRDGRRVETGIYLIQCTTTDGVTRNVGKIHVVK
ncbi:MAG: hypothetical protein J6X32_02365 [Salinivirgaceae bacterium]|nr:hypothetical protein [Salinivirgaceae bacterium]